MIPLMNNIRLTIKTTNCESVCVHVCLCGVGVGGGGSVLLSYVMITATGLYAVKMMRYFPIVPKRFRAPICLHFAAVF